MTTLENTVHRRYGTPKTRYTEGTVHRMGGGIQKIEIFFVVVGENINISSQIN